MLASPRAASDSSVLRSSTLITRSPTREVAAFCSDMVRLEPRRHDARPHCDPSTGVWHTLLSEVALSN